MPMLVLTRSQEDNQYLIDKYSSREIEFFSFPCIEFAPPSDDYKSLDQALRNNHNYDWVFFLSRKAAEVFFERLLALGGHFFHLSPRLRIACVGEGTRDFVQNQIGFPVDFVPSEFNANALLEQFLEKFATEGFIPGMDSKRILIPRNEEVTDNLQSIAAQQIEYELEICPAYRTGPAQISQSTLMELQEKLSYYDEVIVAFASSKTVENFATNVQRIDLGNRLKFLSIGPKTTETIRRFFPTREVLLAKEASFEAMFTELDVLKSAI